MVLAAFITAILVALCVTSLNSSHRALKLATDSNTATTQSSAIVVAQREILVYGIKFSQWMDGKIERRQLQISRATLARQLDVVDQSGVSLRHGATPAFLQILKKSDAIVAAGGPGYLSLAKQKQFKPQETAILDGITNEGHALIDEYIVVVSTQIKGYANSQRAAARLILYLLISSLLLSTIFAIWFVIRIRIQLRKQRIANLTSEQSLEEVRERLGVAHEEVLTLQSINEAKTDFVTTVNHELRTPLTSIIGYIDLLQDFTSTESDAEFHKYLNVMDRNASILLELVESILFLSALDSRDTLTDTAVIDLIELCEKCVAAQWLAIKTSKIKIVRNYDQAQNFSVLGNRTLLMQVFTNLISNAVKFSPENSKIDISFSRFVNEQEQEIVRVEVRDQGIGIPSEDLSRLFSRFFRASNATRSEIPGSGLGLAIVKRIVELHQGKIFAESTLGEGTSMIVELPFSISALEELVMSKREDVLRRAINSIAQGEPEQLMDITHDVGGAIGFYTFTQESDELINFSRWLKSNPTASPSEVTSKKESLLAMLNQTFERIKSGGVS